MPEKKQQKREDFTMIITTTPSVEGRAIREYKGIAFGEVITGVNVIKDFGAGLRNFFGGRSAGYEEELQKAREEALKELEQRAAEYEQQLRHGTLSSNEKITFAELASLSLIHI